VRWLPLQHCTKQAPLQVEAVLVETSPTTSQTVRAKLKAMHQGAQGHRRGHVALLLVMAAQSCLWAAVAAAAGGAEISPSVLMIGEFDWKLEQTSKGDTWSRCLDMLWRGVERAESSEVGAGCTVTLRLGCSWLCSRQGQSLSLFAGVSRPVHQAVREAPASVGSRAEPS
jgi:hypothetical protein